MIGQTVLHYRIIEKLGEGGMGVVYKAEDTTLHRTVALKFLPEKASASEKDKARFMQEARAAANLNHPNICTIHAIEEFEGRTFIAMECVEGATLNEKIPFRMLNQAFDAAIQAGEALAEAHSKGIVHRDVKSENIMITPKGQVKVMDFGLAKLKGSLKLTRTSSTVGTLGYMSPEQIQGGEVDNRSDIFSLGVVLFEMLTGQLPFRGEHEAAIVYSIANEEPKRITDLLPAAPPALEEIFAKAFEKDPNERYQSAADFAVDLKRLKKQSSQSRSRSSVQAMGKTPGPDSAESSAALTPAEETMLSGHRGNRGSKAALIVVGVLLAVAVGYIGYLKGYVKIWSGERSGPPSLSVIRLTEQAGAETSPDISPDGNYIAYVKAEGNTSDIFVQRAGGGNPLNITNAAASVNTQPAYSPKGDLIAFRSERDGGGIFLMGSTGESVRRLTDFGYNPSWSPEGGRIVVAAELIQHPFSRATESKLWTIDIATGKSVELYSGDAVQPQWSPDGRWIVFWGLPRGTGRRELWTVSSTGGPATRLTEDDYIDWDPQWSPDGRAIYFLSDRGGTMNVWRLGFDPGSGTADGAPVPVTLPTQNCTGLRISRDGGKFIYVSSEVRGNIYKVPFDPVRLMATGMPTAVTEGSREFGFLEVSPDGKNLAFSLMGVQEDIGVIGTDGKGFRKLTNDRAKDRGPSWSPDGKHIAFYSERSGNYQIWTVRADGSGFTQVTSETNTGILAWPIWLRGGTAIYYQQDASGSIIDNIKPGGGSATKQTRLPEYPGGGQFGGVSVSPDGKTLAGSPVMPDGISRGIVLYSLSDSTFTEIYDRGERPFWLRDGKTIFFLDEGTIRLLDVGTKKVTPLDGFPPFRAEGLCVISPDNRTIYFVKAESESDIWAAILK